MAPGPLAIYGRTRREPLPPLAGTRLRSRESTRHQVRSRFRGLDVEEEGIATVTVVLIRPQAEGTKPPRALWVPFELGRPFGPPNDPAFQGRVVLAALGMLVEGDGPVRIIDFPDDDPRARPYPAWQPPFMPAAVASGSAESLASRLEAELLLLQGAHRRWMEQYGRSTVGLSGLVIGDCARYVADWLRGKAPPSPRDRFSAPLILRFAVDDLKAYCLEVAGAGSAKPSSLQLTDWFWNETATGARCCRRKKTSVCA